jgi:hypothetical protein
MIEPFDDLFLSLSDQQKIVALAWLSHELTIHGRGFGLDLVGNDQIAAFKGLNELQHKISQDIGHLAQGTNRQGGEDILQTLRGTAAHYGLASHLRSSFAFLLRVAQQRREQPAS